MPDNSSDATPKYHQIANSIRRQIITGELKPGDSVPSERRLEKEWNVARPTAADALRTLRHQGYVESRHGSGTYVRKDLPGGHGKRFAPSRTVDVGFRGEVTLEPILAEETVAPSHVADAFGQHADSLCARRVVLVNDANGTPAELRTSWFPAEIASLTPLLLDLEQPPTTIDEYVTTQTRRVPTYGRDQVSARLASTTERKRLQLPNPSAVLEMHLIVFDANGGAIRFDESVFPAEVWRLLQPYPLSD